MSVFARPDAGGPPPPALLFGLATSHYVARTLQVIATSKVADHLGATPCSASDLAAKSGTNADALHRMLRLLESHGVFRFTREGWVHTPASELLRTDHPQSMNAFAAMMGDGLNLKSLEALDHSLRTGQASSLKVHPQGVWAYYEGRPDDARQFDAAMTAKSQGDIAHLLAALELDGAKTIADIGGGRGHFLRAILDAHPDVQGVLYDQAAVVAAAAEHPRQRKQVGDFFQTDLPTVDLYLLSQILHDWDDASSIAILRNIRTAARPGAQLVVYELSLPEDAAPHPAKVLDVLMLTITGGRERTPAQFAQLFRAAGWVPGGVRSTESGMALHLARAE